MTEIRYSREHEYIIINGDEGIVGISSHAQEQLGDIVFVDLPEAGKVVRQNQEAATVESVKAASDVYAPVSGTVIESNAALADNPALINEDPQGKGWFFKIKLSNKEELGSLMDEAAYAAYLKDLG